MFTCRSRSLKVLVTVLILMLTVTMLPALPAYADDEVHFSNGYRYKVAEGTEGKVAQITGYIGEDKELIIPETLDGLPVMSIESEAFAGCATIKSLTIPDHIKNVDVRAFMECTNLEHVKWFVSSITIPNNAFDGCTSLKTVDICDTVQSIQYEAFRGCTSLEGISIGTSESHLTRILAGAFDGCSSLNNITYAGKESWWKDIDKGSLNSALQQADIYFMTGNLPVFKTPANIKVKYLDLSTVRVTWDPVDRADHYEIVMKAPDGVVQTRTVSAADYASCGGWDNGFISIGVNKVTIKAVGFHSNDPVVSKKTIKVYGPSESVKWKKASRSGRTITLKWNKKTYAHGYVLRYFFYKESTEKRSKVYVKYISKKKTSYKIKVPKKYETAIVSMVPYVKQGKKKYYSNYILLNELRCVGKKGKMDTWFDPKDLS